MLQQLLEREQHVGTHDSSGSFAVDLPRAAQKLGLYQTTEPLFFLLKLVQAAVAAGATEIRLRQRAHKLQLLAHGVGPRHFDLSQLRLGHPQLQDRPEAYLATGLSAALAQGASRALCMVGGQQLLVTPDGAGFATVPPLQYSFVVLVEGSPLRLGRQRLQERLAYAPLPIYFEGALLNRVSTAEATLDLTDLDDPAEGVASPYNQRVRYQDCKPAPSRHRFALNGRFVPICRAVLELHNPELMSRVVLVKHGVVLTSAPALKLPGALCVVSAEGLQLDISSLQVVENERFFALLRDLEQQLRNLYWNLVSLWPTEDPEAAAAEETRNAILVGVVAAVFVVLACFTGPGAIGGLRVSFGSFGSSTKISPEGKLAWQLRRILEAR